MFTFLSRPQNPSNQTQWFPAGLASSYPDISDPPLNNNNSDSDSPAISDPRPCGGGDSPDSIPGCKVFSVPGGNISSTAEVPLSDVYEGADLQDQVLVFRYRGKFHAVDHKCPHSSFPLSKGTPFDIEDFGIVLSAGVTCPKHGWSFDLFSGMGDRGAYKLRTWEVELRPGKEALDGSTPGEEVWVRKKQRMG